MKKSNPPRAGRCSGLRYLRLVEYASNITVPKSAAQMINKSVCIKIAGLMTRSTCTIRAKKKPGAINVGGPVGFHFFMQSPIVGEVPHLAPSADPPLGQNAETSVSPVSQLTAPSAACT